MPFLTRRTVLQSGLAGITLGALWPWSSWAEGVVVNDVTRLNPIRVHRVLTPRTTDEIREALAGWAGPVSIGGARYSMGGQIACEDSLHLDMRQFSQVVHFSPQDKVIRVQAGICWRDLQAVIDPHDLSVKIMQSYANFTVGGALSVNAHGRYVGAGPVSNSVRALQLVLADGTQLEASRSINAELFHGVIGGYGALAIITEVELELVPNLAMEREIRRMPVADYPAFFNRQVRANPLAILHNADLAPPRFDQATAITWLATDKAPTVKERLVAPGQSYALDKTVMWAVTRLPGGAELRTQVVDPLRYLGHPVLRRNYEASRDVASLGPIATRNSTYALQEYFVPVDRLGDFVERMATILRTHDVDAINVSVRHSPATPEPLMTWARQEVFSFVLYYWQHTTEADRSKVGTWTRELIEAALALGGTWYLPYQLHATREQFARGYPEAPRLLALKARVDPANRLRNTLWDKYTPVH